MYDKDSLDDAMEVLQQEKERRQIMDIIRAIRATGGEETILKLAGCILMSPKQAKEVG